MKNLIYRISLMIVLLPVLSYAQEKAKKFPREYYHILEKRGDLFSMSFADSDNESVIYLLEKWSSGSYVVYHRDTKNPAANITYSNGLLNGKVTAFYKSSELWYEGQYLNGKPTGVWIWYFKSGKKKAQAEFKEGKLNGVYTAWNEEETKVREVCYKDSKEHGSFKEWWENGELKIQSNYEDGFVKDSTSYFNIAGNLDSLVVIEKTVKQRKTEIEDKRKEKSKIIHEFKCKRKLTSLSKKSTLVEITITLNEPYSSFLKFEDVYSKNVKVSDEKFHSGTLKSRKGKTVTALFWSFPKEKQVVLSYIVNKSIEKVKSDVSGSIRYISYQNERKTVAID